MPKEVLYPGRFRQMILETMQREKLRYREAAQQFFKEVEALCRGERIIFALWEPG